MSDRLGAAAGPMADLVATALLRDLMVSGKTWADARDLYIWEREALDWLASYSGSARMNDWTRMILESGYPPASFIDRGGRVCEAGCIWRPS